ncbi:hypothetical protein [Ramlibacter algicola]|uniref:Uncharacterized protein n=1 Tax=Ramlibacter algicola TaxID=2795217 RepID=A0A934PYJ2_9BURK|nr:hypothetical protein [Ramlibacter algicola]MBK0391047.1 hypothetical protein [Ramlibacter algicola]
MAAPDTLMPPPRTTGAVRASRAPRAAPEPSAIVHRKRMGCRGCGEPWFGAVDYCPYCGRPSAPVRRATLPPKQEPRLDPFDATESGAAALATRTVYQHPGALRVATPAQPQAPEPRARGLRSIAITLAGAVALVLLVLGLQDVLDRVTRARTPAIAPAVAAPAPQQAAPPAAAHVEPVATPAPPVPAPPPAPPARNRSLCSAANEAAGLCNPH